MAAVLWITALLLLTACPPAGDPPLTTSPSALPSITSAALATRYTTPPPSWTPASTQTPQGSQPGGLPTITPRASHTPWPTATPMGTPPPATVTPILLPTGTPTTMPSPTQPGPVTGNNLLPNPSFEEGWYHPGGRPELQVPTQWRLEYDEGPNPLDPDPWNVFVRPESRVLPREFLPAHEHDLFIWDGDHTVKIFKREGSISIRLLTDIYLAPGSYVFEVSVFPDLIVGYNPDGSKIWAPDPLSGEIRFALDSGGTGWLLPEFGRKNTFSFPFDIPVAGSVQLGLAIRGRWAIENNGWFMDDWGLWRTQG
jgi:hypothetical protein